MIPANLIRRRVDVIVFPVHSHISSIISGWQARPVNRQLPRLDQIVHIRAALHQGGSYDFQRDPTRQEIQPAYANASNYAVGVYLAGAGYPAWAARKMAEAYALFKSSDYGSKHQTDWLDQGWQDATTGRWK
jgi:hypothetical protein